MSDAFTIRPIRDEEYELLPKMERAADERFIEIGHFTEEDIGPDDFSLERYTSLNGDVFMAVDGHDQPMGFVYVRPMEQGCHVEELSVLPEHGRKGVGSALMKFAIERAEKMGEFAVTLSTDIHIPWNAPFYAKLGFEPVSPMALGKEYVELRQIEADKELDPTRRQFMVYYLNPVSRNEPSQ